MKCFWNRPHDNGEQVLEDQGLEDQKLEDQELEGQFLEDQVSEGWVRKIGKPRISFVLKRPSRLSMQI